MIYSLPYIALICTFCFLAFWYDGTKDGRLRKRIVWFSIGLMVFFFGFRGFCFYDWNSYYPLFQRYSMPDLFSYSVIDWPFEPGFSFLMCLCKAIVNDYIFFVFSFTVLGTILLVRFLSKNVDNIPFALMICICMNGLVLFTDLMRNSVSILLFINSIEYINKRKFLPYLILCLIGATFHISSFMYIPLYFFLHRKFNKWLLLGIFIVGNLIYLFRIPVFMSIVNLFIGFISPALQLKIDAYMNMLPSIGFRISIGYIERLITGALLFCYIERLRALRPDGNIYINGLILYFVMFFFFSEFKVISLRLSYLFSFGYWIIWYDLVKCFSVDNNRRLFVSFVCLYCVIKIYSSTNYIIARYDNVIFGAQPYHVREYIYNKNFAETQQ